MLKAELILVHLFLLLFEPGCCMSVTSAVGGRECQVVTEKAQVCVSSLCSLWLGKGLRGLFKRT